MRILVTGGAGYIGSHTCVELLTAGYDVVMVDNLSNSKISVLDRIATITGRRPVFCQADCRDRTALRDVFAAHPCDANSFRRIEGGRRIRGQTLYYYDNNIGSTLALCEVMAACGVKRLVFSSSATVYGDPATVPIRGTFPWSHQPHGAPR